MAAKRIFYINGNGLFAFYCDKRDVVELGHFDSSAEGIAAFGEQLQQAPDVPSALLVDVVEEEFRSDTIPHVQGRGDRRKLLERKLATLFRQTPFRSARLIGREPKDKRRDRVLFTALTRPQSIEPWLSELGRHKVPLVGVYSLAMLTQLLVKKLVIDDPNALLLTIQQRHLLRQSFFSHGVLKISRLTPLSGDDEDRYLNVVLHEVERNQRYLGRLQLLEFGKPMAVVVISGGEPLQRLKQGCQDSAHSRYHFIDINEVAEKIGFAPSIPGDQCERCFAYLLSRNLPATNYAPSESRTYSRFYTSRKLMVAVSVVLAMAAMLWSLFSIYEGQQFRQRAVQVEAQTGVMAAEYQHEAAELPALPYSPRVMAAAVAAERQLAQHKPQTLGALTIIGASLSRHTNIDLDELQWRVGLADELMAQDDAPAPAGGRDEVALIKAHLKRFPRNYQAAFDEVEAFMRTLESDRRVRRVEALVLPLEIAPASSLAGESQRFGDLPQANFELRVWLNDDQ